MNIERKYIGLFQVIGFLMGIEDNLKQYLRVSVDDDNDWGIFGYPTSPAFLNIFESLKVKSQLSNYNEMYKWISGSKTHEFTFHANGKAWNWGVFHKDGKITGWYHYNDQIDKKQGEFYIIKKGIFTSLIPWDVKVLGEDLPSQPTLEKAWVAMNDYLIKKIENGEGVSQMLLEQCTWATTENIPKDGLWNFHKLRDHAHDQGWLVKRPNKNNQE